MSLTLRNTSRDRIHGVTLRVVAQEVTLGGKGSVTYPSLNVGPGEAFPVRIDMQLMRPSQVAGGPLVQVDLDGVLFQDLSFLRSRPAEFAAHHDGVRDGSAARPRAFQAHAGAGRRGRPLAARNAGEPGAAEPKFRSWQ